MPKIDTTDEAIIDAPPNLVYKAILDVYSGVTNWWMPHLESQIRGNRKVLCWGEVCDIKGHSHGGTTRFSAKVTKTEEDKLIELELTGDFEGIETWTFESIQGKTKAKLHYVGKTNRLLFSVLSPFVNMGNEHSKTIQVGLKACNQYLTQK